MKCYNCSLTGETAVPLMVLQTASAPNCTKYMLIQPTLKYTNKHHSHSFSSWYTETSRNTSFFLSYKGLSAVSPRSPQTAYFSLLNHCPHIHFCSPTEWGSDYSKNLIALFSFFLLCISDKNLSISCNFKPRTCSDFFQSAQPQLLQCRAPSLSDPSGQSSSESYILCLLSVLKGYYHTIPTNF